MYIRGVRTFNDDGANTMTTETIDAADAMPADAAPTKPATPKKPRPVADGWSIVDWCAKQDRSPSWFYTLPKKDRPALIQRRPGAKARITPQADRAWNARFSKKAV
jgi:hypothetical protein